MKKFITENFANIILAISLLTLVKTCGDSRELTKIRKEIQQIKDSTYTKKELEVELRISGLEAEKRMIQATEKHYICFIFSSDNFGCVGVNISRNKMVWNI